MRVLVNRKEEVSNKGVRETIEKYMDPASGVTFVMVERNSEDIKGKSSMFNCIFAEFGTLDAYRNMYPYARCIIEKPQEM